jgi:SAM-dependent methyltransferase
MPFESGSIRTLYGLSFFHHLSDPERFFHEAVRVLNPGGGCVLLDPYYGPVAARFYKRLHAFETYDESAPDWSCAGRAGMAMQDANQALSYIVFTRDRERFGRLFPDLEIVYQQPVPNYLRYLFSGGLNYRPLLPSSLAGLLRLVEKALTPILRVTALYQIIVLRRKLDTG